MKICILGDTHHGMRDDSPIFHELYKKFYLETLFPYLEEHGIDTIVQLGDLFDRRKYINFLSLKLCREYFFDEIEKRGFTLHTLIGNHDIFYKNTLAVNSTQLLLGGYSNIIIHDKPTTVKFDDLEFDMVPWVCNENENEIVDFISKSKSDFCAGHFELSGFEMDRGNFCHDGWDSAKLSRYETVFTGHFHHRSINGNIFYVGSPGEMTWADYEDPRGFHIFDTATRDIEFIENPHTIYRKYTYNDSKIFFDELDQFNFEQFRSKYVKIIVESRSNAFLFETFIDRLLKVKPADVSVVEDFTEAVGTEEIHKVDQADDTITILDKYVDTIEVPLNKAKLKSIIKDVYLEALTVET